MSGWTKKCIVSFERNFTELLASNRDPLEIIHFFVSEFFLHRVYE